MQSPSAPPSHPNHAWGRRWGTRLVTADFVLQEIGVTPFVDETEKPNRVVARFVAELKRKRLSRGRAEDLLKVEGGIFY